MHRGWGRVEARVALAAAGMALATAVTLGACGASSAPSPAAPTASPAPATPTEEPFNGPTDEPTTPPPSVDPSAPGAACPTDSDASLNGVLALKRTLVVAGTALERDGTITIEAKNGSYAADDAIPAFATLKLDATPIQAAAGGPLVVTMRGATLVSVDPAKAYELAGFTKLPDSPPNYTGSGARSLTASIANGAGAVTLPDAGTWVIELNPHWDTECYTGSGVVWVVVDAK